MSMSSNHSASNHSNTQRLRGDSNNNRNSLDSMSNNHFTVADSSSGRQPVDGEVMDATTTTSGSSQRNHNRCHSPKKDQPGSTHMNGVDCSTETGGIRPAVGGPTAAAPSQLTVRLDQQQPHQVCQLGAATPAVAGASRMLAIPSGITIQRVQCFKTKRCRFWLEGRCTRGDACTYAHTDIELRAPPDLTKTKLCTRWKRGICDKTPQECAYAHGIEDLRDSNMTPSTTASRTSRSLLGQKDEEEEEEDDEDMDDEDDDNEIIGEDIMSISSRVDCEVKSNHSRHEPAETAGKGKDRRKGRSEQLGDRTTSQVSPAPDRFYGNLMMSALPVNDGEEGDDYDGKFDGIEFDSCHKLGGNAMDGDDVSVKSLYQLHGQSMETTDVPPSMMSSVSTASMDAASSDGVPAGGHQIGKGAAAPCMTDGAFAKKGRNDQPQHSAWLAAASPLQSSASRIIGEGMGSYGNNYGSVDGLSSRGGYLLYPSLASANKDGNHLHQFGSKTATAFGCCSGSAVGDDWVKPTGHHHHNITHGKRDYFSQHINHPNESLYQYNSHLSLLPASSEGKADFYGLAIEVYTD